MSNNQHLLNIVLHLSWNQYSNKNHSIKRYRMMWLCAHNVLSKNTNQVTKQYYIWGLLKDGGGLVALCNPVDCSLPGFSVHGISQARILAWVAIPFSREFSKPSDGIQVSCIAGRFFTWGRAVHCPPLGHTPLGGAYFCQHLEVEVRDGKLGLLLVRTAPKDCGRCQGGTQPVAKPSPNLPFAEPSV